MAYSGSYDYSVTRDDIIKGALRTIGIIKRGTVPPTVDVTDVAQALNLMIKAWQAEGIGLWLNKMVTVFLQDATQAYDMSAASGHHTTSYVATTLDADAESGDLTIEVASATGIASAYYIAVMLDDGTLQWTTVNGAPSDTTVTLAAALTDDASSGNAVFCYQTKAQKPMQILGAWLRDSSGFDLPLQIVGRDEYEDIGDKDSEGAVSKVYYDPQLTTGKLYIWPSPDDAASVVRLLAKYPAQDLDAATDTPDFPIEWAEALKFNLALRIAPEFMDDVAEDRMKYIVALAENSLKSAMRFDAELGTSVYMTPDCTAR